MKTNQTSMERQAKQGEIIRISAELSLSDNETNPALTTLNFPFEIEKFIKSLKENKLPVKLTINQNNVNGNNIYGKTVIIK